MSGGGSRGWEWLLWGKRGDKERKRKTLGLGV
jgi:hypothetical protein